MDGVAGQSGWRWIFIIEGLPTFVLGIATFFVLADNPETAFYLTPAEKELAKTRLQRQTGYTASAQEFHWKDVVKGLKDWKVWAFCFGQFGADTMLYGYSTFLPTIIKGINPQYSSAIVQVLTVPVSLPTSSPFSCLTNPSSATPWAPSPTSPRPISATGNSDAGSTSSSSERSRSLGTLYSWAFIPAAAGTRAASWLRWGCMLTLDCRWLGCRRITRAMGRGPRRQGCS